MKRDMDAIRSIMLALEASKGQPDLTFMLSDSFTTDDLGYHLYLIHDAGLAEGMSIESSGVHGEICPTVILHRLNWRGHEFLDKARSDTLWTRAKQAVSEAGVGMTIAALSQALGGLAENSLQSVIDRIQ